MSSSSNINDRFFAGSYKEAWRRIIPNALTEAEIDFIQEVCCLQKGETLLDLMCGYGRHALKLAERGINVTAVDNLPGYIEEIKEKSGQLSLPVEAIEASALNVILEKSYDAVICMGNSFAFFNQQDAIRILKNISEHLKSNGVLIINSWMIAEIAIRHFKERDWHYAGNYKCMLEYKYHFHPARIESEQTIISPDGTVEVIPGVDYIFTLDELEFMFNEAGLKTRALYSTPRKKKFALGDGHIYIVAEKIPG